MAEHVRVVREQRRLETNMNVPPVDENLYVFMLRNESILHETQQRQLNGQNNRDK